MTRTEGDLSAEAIWQIGIGLFAGVVLLRPLHLLIHELGHAAAILALTSAIPTIRIGHGPSWGTARVGGLVFQLGSEGLLQADCGYECNGVTRRNRLVIAGAGPFFSLAAMIGSLLLGSVANGSWMQAAFLGSAWVHGRIFVTSAWPRHGTRPSDGGQIRELLDRSVA